MTVHTAFTRKLTFLPALFVLLLLASGPGFCDPLEVVDLGFYSVRGDLNNNGQVTGYADNQAVIWDADNGITKIDPGEGFFSSVGQGINNNGHVVGYAIGFAGFEGFYWNGATTTDIGNLGGSSFTEACDINDNNAITGGSSTAEGDEHVFLWINGTIQDLGTLGGVISVGQAINNSNEIAGYSEADTGYNHAFLWSNGVMQDLGTLGGIASAAHGINEACQVVGRSVYDDVTTNYQAFLWENGSMTGLGFLAGDYSYASDINNLAQIVGYSEFDDQEDGSYHAVLWQNNELIDLNDLIDESSGWVLERALEINDNGVIRGTGTLNGEDSNFLLDISSAVDSDADGIADADDNCPATANADQTDTDADGYGNMCDCDIDGEEGGNGAVNMADYAVFRAAYGSTGSGDASENWNADADFNGDLEVNMADYAIFRSRWLQTAPFK